MPRALLPLIFFVQSLPKEKTGIYFVDSTPIKVCHTKRTNSNKTFKGIAKKSKSTMGWFLGFKLHIIVNDLGQIMNFKCTKANVDDRNPILELAKCLVGKMFGDRGYISKSLFEKLMNKGLQLITRIKSNMKNILMSVWDKLMLRKRAIVESIIDQLKNISQIADTAVYLTLWYLNS
eukprot:Pgem_evm2s17506